MFEKERSQFKEQLDARRKEISALKKEKQLTEDRIQVIEDSCVAFSMV